MLAPCVCVRECAPERGGARRRCLPFLASFGLSKFGCSQHSNDGWTVPSACAAIYARRGAALGPRVARIAARTSSAIFFGCKTRDENPRRASTAARTSSRPGCRPRLQDQGWDQSPAFGKSPRSPALVLCSRLPQPKGEAIRTLSRCEHRLLLLTHSFTIGCAWRAQPTPWVSTPSSLSGCYARGGSISQRRPPSSVRGSGAALFAAP